MYIEIANIFNSMDLVADMNLQAFYTGKMEIRKWGLISGISVKKINVWFFPTDFPINRQECDADCQ